MLEHKCGTWPSFQDSLWLTCQAGKGVIETNQLATQAEARHVRLNERASNEARACISQRPPRLPCRKEDADLAGCEPPRLKNPCGCASKIGTPNDYPGKWKHGPTPVVPWWFNFNPYPCCNRRGLENMAGFKKD